MTVSKRVRYEVLRRDDFTCRYCHSKDNPLQVDHVIPVALGGTDGPDNLVAACKDCNIGKTSVQPDEPLVQNVSAEALAFGEAFRQALCMQSVDIEWESNYVEDLEETWEAETSIDDEHCLPLPDSWRSTARYLASLRVPYSIFEYAFQIAKDKVDMGKIPPRVAFSYAKAIINNKIEESYGQAKKVMDDGA